MGDRLNAVGAMIIWTPILSLIFLPLGIIWFWGCVIVIIFGGSKNEQDE